MTFDEVLGQVLELLQQEKRVSYRGIQRRFSLDEACLADLKEELVFAHPEIADVDGRGLVWNDEAARVATPVSAPPQSPAPASYTPPHLAERIRAEQAALEARGVTNGERKTITALFADLAGFTALARDLDPEVTRAIVDPALQLMMEAVHRYEGYVAQSLGDGIFALFGAPIAHENHPQRAVYAALRMQEDIKQYADTLRLERSVPLQMRVGINTGEVVVRSIRTDDLHTDYVPVGHSTNLASRMESLATPGTIVVSEQTHKLTEGYFAYKALGAVQVKGLEEPVSIYEVEGIGPLRTKLQVASRRGLARFVGRQREMESLQNALAQAKAGHGQIVGVMGEPGVGKSRLFYEFKLLSQVGCLVLETFSVSHGKAYPYLPLVDLLKNYFQLTAQDDERKRRERITGKVLTLDRSLEDTLPYLFHLLGIAEPESPLQQMDPQIRRKRTLETIKRLLVRESLNQPLILIFEDLHWLDNETQAFLSLFSESLANAKVLLLVNYRPEYRHEWGNKTYYTRLRLDPLGREHAEEMLAALLAEKLGATGQSPLHQSILEKTEGNPFFMEEIVQALVEEGLLTHGAAEACGHASLPTDIHLPPTVQAVLASRIDRLPPEEKELLQTLAVIGREFSLPLLKHVVDYSEDTLQPLLSHLRDAEFIYEQPAFPESEYVFKHAFTQEVAYTSLLQERRRILHERAAQAIETLFHARIDDHYSELASHYGRSGNTQKAANYLQLAGQQAVQRSANAEAISDLTTALELLKTLPDSPERARQELLLQTVLGPVLIATKGYGAPEVEKAYTRARELCQQVGETPQLFPVLFGLQQYYLGREIRSARELGEQLLGLAQRHQDSTLLLVAHNGLGCALAFLGEMASGRVHLEQSIALYNPHEHRSLAFLYAGFDPGVDSASHVAHVLWLLGYPDQALKRSHEALLWAQELSHPYSLAHGLGLAAVVHQLRRERHAVQERADAVVALSREQGFAWESAQGTILQGWILIEQGQKEEGLAKMRQGLAAYRATGAELWQPYFLALLAEGYRKGGRPKEGLSVLSEALAQVDKTEERNYEAELYRLKGALLLQQFKGQGSQLDVKSSSECEVRRSESEAEECFLKAIEIARRQQAKSLELRATVSLARLWQRQEKHHAAHDTLSKIYGWFTEGFDTADLQEAKALLETLHAV